MFKINSFRNRQSTREGYSALTPILLFIIVGVASLYVRDFLEKAIHNTSLQILVGLGLFLLLLSVAVIILSKLSPEKSFMRSLGYSIHKYAREMALVLILFIIVAVLVNKDFIARLFGSNPLDFNWKTLISPIFETLLVLFSILVTVLAMHHAFLAEENSAMLRREKGDFIEGFSGFINRINRRISPDPANRQIGKMLGGLIDDISQSREKRFYLIECMFLTPFMGQAAIVSYLKRHKLRAQSKKVRESFSEFKDLNINLGTLIKADNCFVRILTQNQEKLARWFMEIMLVDLAMNGRGKIRKNRLGFLQDRHSWQRALIKSLIIEQFWTRSDRPIASDISKWSINNMPTFTQLCRYYKERYGQGIMQVCHADYIPFQFFLVMEAKRKRRIGVPIAKQEVADWLMKKEFDKYIELDGKFAVLTYVGDRTYWEILEDLRNGEFHKIKRGGIAFLLNRLHAGIYTENPLECLILHTHFKHYWTHDVPNGKDVCSYPRGIEFASKAAGRRYVDYYLNRISTVTRQNEKSSPRQTVN